MFLFLGGGKAFVLFLAFRGGDGGTQAFALTFFAFGGSDGGTQGPELALESLASSGAGLGLFSAAGADLGAGLGLLCGTGGDLGAGVRLLSGAGVGVLSGAGVGPLWAAGEFAGSEPGVVVSVKCNPANRMYRLFQQFDVCTACLSSSSLSPPGISRSRSSHPGSTRSTMILACPSGIGLP